MRITLFFYFEKCSKYHYIIMSTIEYIFNNEVEGRKSYLTMYDI